MIRRIIDRTASLILPICNYDAQQLLPSPAMHVVYNFIDFAHFDARIDGTTLRERLDVGPGQVVVLMLGGFNPIKGTREFVDAAVSLLETHPDAVFMIAGPIPDPSIRNRINGLSVYMDGAKNRIPQRDAHRIRFLGVRSDVPELLAASDILCFPSTVPHFARPVIEASAMGLPVIASDLGGPRELVRHEETGILVPPADSAALADAMKRLIADPDLREKMGSNGRVFAAEQFDAQHNTREVLKLYDGIFDKENVTRST
jgi:glycosyltransferase involved in cell wall biosynthesis